MRNKMRPLTTIILGMSSITLAYPDTSKFQVLFTRHPPEFLSHEITNDLLYSRSLDEIDSALLWRRSGQHPPRPGRTSYPPSQAAFSGSALKPSSKSTVSGTSEQGMSQLRTSRPLAGVTFAQSSKGPDNPSVTAKPSRAQGGPLLPKSALSGAGKDRGRTQSRSATENPDYSSDQGTDPMEGRSHAERLGDRAAYQRNHDFTMGFAKGVISEAHKNSVDRVNQGKSEPDRPAERYQALKDSKVEVRRANRDAHQKIKVAGQAVRQGPAMGPAAQEKVDSAYKALRKADRLSSGFQVDHIEAAASSAQDGRWSDFPDHVKKEVKVVSRINANKAHFEALKAQRQYRHNTEQLSKIDRADPKRREAASRVADSMVGSITAKKLYSFHHGLYRDARQRFPDDSSSEDEIDTFT